jgi:hypothetical protein
MGILENVAVQWLIRRVPEWGGLIVTLVTFYASIPPHYQAIIVAIVTGQGGGLTVGALIGFAMWAYAQFISFRQTTKPKTVDTVAGKPVEISSGRKSVIDILTGK